jgi:hypothetical protein
MARKNLFSSNLKDYTEINLKTTAYIKTYSTNNQLDNESKTTSLKIKPKNVKLSQTIFCKSIVFK